MSETLCGLVLPENPTVVVERRRIDLATVAPHKKSWWREVVSVGKDAAVNPDTQIKEGPVTTITATQVVDTWTVRDKTQAELDADTAAKEAEKTSQIDRDVNAMVGKALFKIVNEIRVLQSQATLTPAQFKTWFRNQQP